jgi:hypothetical protein
MDRRLLFCQGSLFQKPENLATFGVGLNFTQGNARDQRLSRP